MYMYIFYDCETHDLRVRIQQLYSIYVCEIKLLHVTLYTECGAKAIRFRCDVFLVS